MRTPHRETTEAQRMAWVAVEGTQRLPTSPGHIPRLPQAAAGAGLQEAFVVAKSWFLQVEAWCRLVCQRLVKAGEGWCRLLKAAIGCHILV